MLHDRAQEPVEPVVGGQEILELVDRDDDQIAVLRQFGRELHQVADRGAALVGAGSAAARSWRDLQLEPCRADRQAEPSEATLEDPGTDAGQLAQAVDDAIRDVADGRDPIEVDQARVMAGLAHRVEVRAQQRRLPEPPGRGEPHGDAVRSGALQGVELLPAVDQSRRIERTLVLEGVHAAIVRHLRHIGTHHAYIGGALGVPIRGRALDRQALANSLAVTRPCLYSLSGQSD
ncbi:hypothetical protein [Patulibacter medicamentivorans]|uniref:hypothetical protein n=1 Tax=Patulibacter medicamentivorans TaxID=1097667 RepID=UPI00111049C5|nr:hypothetical protein [Patulibacter medicamentivorans]